MTNTELIKQKIDDIISLLIVTVQETQGLEAKQLIFEKSSIVNSQREQRLNEIAKNQAKERTDLDAQKKYIEEQNSKNQLILDRLKLEKETLGNLAAQKKEIEKERLQLENDIKAHQSRMEKLEHDRTLFEQEKTITKKWALANEEHNTRLSIFEKQLESERKRLQSIQNSI